MAYLYRLTSPTGKSYIGITRKLGKRMNDHRSSAKNGIRTLLYAAIRKYKWESFSMEVMAIGSFEYVKELEIKAIAAFGTMNPSGYNMTRGGDGMLGRKPSAKTRNRLSRALKGRVTSDDTRMKISGKMKQVCDEAWRKRRSESQRRLWADPEYKAMMLAKRGRKRVQSG